MNETLWKNIAAVYDLGAWSTPPQAVTGGLKHRLYQARTTRGEYAVKVLNPRLLREPGRPARYKRAEQIAQAAARAGLPAIPALPGPDGPVQVVGPVTVMVFPWLSGTILSPGPASPDAAHQIGALLGRLHALAPDVHSLEPPPSWHFSDAYWARAVRQGREDGAIWATAVGEALPDLKRWSASAHQAREALGPGWTATHRDMDQKNVLWSDLHTPWLLDWEEAGAMNPALEVMGSALNWAGVAAGPPAEATFLAFLDGYRDAAPLDPASCRRRRSGQVADLARLQPAMLLTHRRRAAPASLVRWDKGCRVLGLPVQGRPVGVPDPQDLPREGRVGLRLCRLGGFVA